MIVLHWNVEEKVHLKRYLSLVLQYCDCFPVIISYVLARVLNLFSNIFDSISLVIIVVRYYFTRI